ncbi:MAG: 50S ribosomal protein L7/L12 [Candidatus Margulisbacteria bacterium]|nr:50S ribosomal protein L7/L12 [Candidatus Margulisiibacteriota bacterium]
MEIVLSKEAQTVLDTVEKMSVLDLSHLVKALEEKFGVTAAAPVAVAAAAVAGGDVAQEAVTDEVSVVLASAGDKKIAVLKVVREITGLGLKEAKEVVDTCPKSIKEGVTKAEAEEIKAKIEAEGGKVEIK